VSGTKFFYKNLPGFLRWLNSNPKVIAGDMEAAGVGNYLYTYQATHNNVIHYLAIKGITDFFNYGTAPQNQIMRNKNRKLASKLAAEFTGELVEEIEAFEKKRPIRR